MSEKLKIIRSSTVPGSIDTFCQDTLRHLSDEYEVVVVSSPGEAMRTIAQREGVRTVDVPMERRIAPMRDLRSLAGLVKVFRRERPDMVHSITPKAGLLCMMAAWLCRVPVRLHTFTGLVFPTAVGLKRRILMFTDWLTCACATHIVPEGEGVKADLLQNGITRKPLRVLGHGNVRGVDMEHYSRTPEVMEQAAAIRREGEFTFVFVGRIVRDKGINELVEAFARLHRELPATRLLLLGDFEDKLDPISDEARRELNDNSAIEAVGRQSDVRPWLAASDALVFPSYREGFPNAVLEAGAMGLPSIVTDINGSREIVIEGRNGVIVPSKDTDALYAAMRRFATDAQATAQMAAESRPLVESRFEKGYVEQCLRDYYHNLLGNLRK